MIVKRFPDEAILSQELSGQVFNCIKESAKLKNKFVLGLPTGSTPILFYKYLLENFKETGKDIDLHKFYTFNLDEYYPINKYSDGSFYSYMLNNLWRDLEEINPTFSHKTNSFIPDSQSTDVNNEANKYEEKIQSLGGIDLQILGIGINGHIGFNEPGSEKSSKTRLIELTSDTRVANSKAFGSIDKVPTHAITMGISTILKAEKIILIATGGTKRNILQKILSLKSSDSEIPASFLLDHKNSFIYTDIEI